MLLASSPPLPNPGRQLNGGGSCEAKISFGGWRGWGLLKGRNELGQVWGVGSWILWAYGKVGRG